MLTPMSDSIRTRSRINSVYRSPFYFGRKLRIADTFLYVGSDDTTLGCHARNQHLRISVAVEKNRSEQRPGDRGRRLRRFQTRLKKSHGDAIGLIWDLKCTLRRDPEKHRRPLPTPRAQRGVHGLLLAKVSNCHLARLHRVSRSLASCTSYQRSSARNHPFSDGVSGRELSRASMTKVEARPSQAAGSPYFPWMRRGVSMPVCSTRVRVPLRTLHLTQFVAKLSSACEPPVENAST